MDRETAAWNVVSSLGYLFIFFCLVPQSELNALQNDLV